MDNHPGVLGFFRYRFLLRLYHSNNSPLLFCFSLCNSISASSRAFWASSIVLYIPKYWFFPFFPIYAAYFPTLSYTYAGQTVGSTSLRLSDSNIQEFDFGQADGDPADPENAAGSAEHPAQDPSLPVSCGFLSGTT